MASDLLEGLRVLDVTDSSGYLCGRALADLGADVVKVERPGGDAGRAEPPFADDVPGVDRSLVWLAGNANKRGITCNLASPDGRALFRRLAAQADAVVESAAPGTLADVGLDYASLSVENPGLVLTSITPFGQRGSLAVAPAGDLEVTASSGSLWLAGDADGTPVRNTQPQSAAWAGMYAAMGTAMAILARDADPEGRGQHVDVSAQASMVTAISHAPIFWDLLGEEQMRSGPFLVGRSVTGAKFRNIWPCKDGYVTFALYGGAAGKRTSRELVQWMDERIPGGAPAVLKTYDWDSFDVTVTPETVERLEAAIAPFIRGVTKDEFFERWVERNLLGYKVSSVEDIRRDEQLEARGFWASLQAPWDSTAVVPFPGAFALFDGQRPRLERSAPHVGEHNADVYAAWLDLGPSELEDLARRGLV